MQIAEAFIKIFAKPEVKPGLEKAKSELAGFVREVEGNVASSIYTAFQKQFNPNFNSQLDETKKKVQETGGSIKSLIPNVGGLASAFRVFVALKAIDFIAKAVTNVSDKIHDLNARLKEGKITSEDYKVELAKSIPVLNSVFDAWNSITGVTAQKNKADKDSEMIAAGMGRLKKLREEIQVLATTNEFEKQRVAIIQQYRDAINEASKPEDGTAKQAELALIEKKKNLQLADVAAKQAQDAAEKEKQAKEELIKLEEDLAAKEKERSEKYAKAVQSQIDLNTTLSDKRADLSIRRFSAMGNDKDAGVASSKLELTQTLRELDTQEQVMLDNLRDQVEVLREQGKVISEDIVRGEEKAIATLAARTREEAKLTQKLEERKIRAEDAKKKEDERISLLRSLGAFESTNFGGYFDTKLQAGAGGSIGGPKQDQSTSLLSKSLDQLKVIAQNTRSKPVYN